MAAEVNPFVVEKADFCPRPADHDSMVFIIEDPIQSGATATERIQDVTAQTAEERPVLPRGACVGRYVVLSLLGAGGMGAVYKAFDPELDRQIALKMLQIQTEEPSREQRYRARLLREAQALAQLSHPNVVAVYDVGSYGNEVFVAMELVEGETLRAWLSSRQHSRSEIVAAMVEAGQGLAAAHRQGIIHRDFKPENVIVGVDGRVRVLDFGLARAIDPATRQDGKSSAETASTLPEKIDSRPSSSDRGGLASSGSLLGASLTQVGLRVGTPLYMSPEQHMGCELDTRSDQFSYCVVLFETLCGTRPFAAKTRAELTRKILRGDTDQPAGLARVPSYLRAAMARGLSPSPDGRFPSMEELLRALQTDPTIQRRHFWGKVAVALLALALAWLGTLALRKGPDRPRPCQGADERFSQAWNPAVQASLEKAFLGAGVPYAAQALSGVGRLLGTYREEWKRAFQDACEATRVRGEQSEELLDLRMLCLKDRLGEVQALLAVLGQADVRAVEKASSAVGALEPVSGCGNAQALKATLRPPADERSRTQAEAIRKSLSGAKALLSTGNYKDAYEIAARCVGEADALGYRPLTAAAKHVLGVLLEKKGDYAAAESTLEDALWLANVSGDADGEANASIKLAYNVGCLQARYREADHLLRHAASAIERLGGSESLMAEWYNTKGGVFYTEGKDYQQARAMFDKSLALREQIWGKDHPELLHPLNNLGSVHSYLGEYEQARAYYERVLDIGRRHLGAEHPYLAHPLNNLGDVLHGLGRYQEALALAQESLALRERVLGPWHPELAHSLDSIGQALTALKQFGKAEQALGRSLEIRQKALGPDHPGVVETLEIISQMHETSGERGAAIDTLGQALVKCDRGSCADELRFSVRFNLARLLREIGGDPARIRGLIDQALRLGEGLPHKAQQIEKLRRWLGSLSSAPR